jgi:hypothetical protein
LLTKQSWSIQISEISGLPAFFEEMRANGGFASRRSPVRVFCRVFEQVPNHVASMNETHRMIDFVNDRNHRDASGSKQRQNAVESCGHSSRIDVM